MTLDDVGKLTLSDMGTDPPLQAVGARHSAEVDYAALDSEYREIAAQIQAVGAPTDAALPEDHLVITAQVLLIAPSPTLTGLAPWNSAPVKACPRANPA